MTTECTTAPASSKDPGAFTLFALRSGWKVGPRLASTMSLACANSANSNNTSDYWRDFWVPGTVWTFHLIFVTILQGKGVICSL